MPHNYWPILRSMLDQFGSHLTHVYLNPNDDLTALYVCHCGTRAANVLTPSLLSCATAINKSAVSVSGQDKQMSDIRGTNMSLFFTAV